MHHKMRRGWSTPYVGLKKCRSHLLLEVQKTSLPFWKTFTINNVSWIIKDHISLLRTFPFLLSYISYQITVLSPSFLFHFFPVSPTACKRTKNITHILFLATFCGKLWKVHTFAFGRSCTRTYAPIRARFRVFFLFFFSFTFFFFSKITRRHFATHQIDRKSLIGVTAQNRNPAKRTTNKGNLKWREKEGRKKNGKS